MGRLNPAEPDYQLRKLRGFASDYFERHIAAAVFSGGTVTPTAGSTERVYLDPGNPHIVVIESSAVVAGSSAHYIDLPVSSLVLPDPADPRLALYPTL